jgi:ABC-2 type transport system permease protein
MASTSTLQPVSEHGWRTGLRNLLWKELRDWFGTRMWRAQSIIWLLIVNGITAMVLFAPASTEAGLAQVGAEREATALTVFFTMAGMAMSTGMVIMAQDEIIGEKQSGTAAWIMSKPVSRAAFVLAKLLGNVPSILLVMVGLQGLVGLVQISVYRGGLLPLLPFLAAMGLVLLSLLFYLALTVMLGTLFSSRGPVIGIPMLLIFGYQFLAGLVRPLARVMPWMLTIAGEGPSIASALVTGQPLPPLTPVIGTAVLTVVFAGVAVWRFQRDEF